MSPFSIHPKRQPRPRPDPDLAWEGHLDGAVGLGGDRPLVLRGGVQPTHVVVDVTGYLA